MSQSRSNAEDKQGKRENVQQGESLGDFDLCSPGSFQVVVQQSDWHLLKSFFASPYDNRRYNVQLWEMLEREFIVVARSHIS